MRYIVTKNFMDKYTGEYYGIGAVYETPNERRASDLENGGYIAPENTEIARAAQAQMDTQGQVQGQSQQDQQLQQQLQQEVEPYTVLNGEHVPLKEALKVEEMREENINTTGIRQEHDNSTEPVKAGATAKGQVKAKTKQAGKPAALRESNMQSGQQKVQQHMQQAQQQVQQQEQQAQQQAEQAQKSTVNKALEAKGQEFNEAAQLEQHQETAQNAQGTAKAAKAKKE